MTATDTHGATRLLVACIGNVFFGDDGFGVEVARRLVADERAGHLPSGVVFREFGIRGMDFAHALMDAPERVLVVDAMRRGEPPGTLSLIEPRFAEDAKDGGATSPPDGHGLDPARVLEFVRRATGVLPDVRVLGCEPAAWDEPGLSAVVDAAADRAAAWVWQVVDGGWDAPPSPPAKPEPVVAVPNEEERRA